MSILSATPGPRSPLRNAIAWLGPAVGGAVVGSVCGAVAAPELSVLTSSSTGISTGLGVVMGAVGGAVFGRAAAPLLRYGARRGHPAAGRPALTTGLAAVSVLATVVLAMAIWMRVRHRLPGADGLEVVAVNAIGVVVMALSVVAVAIAIGLVTRHALARWAAVLIFSGIAVGTLTALAAADAYHAEPASLLVASTAVLALVLSAPTRHDFHTTTSATMSG